MTSPLPTLTPYKKSVKCQKESESTPISANEKLEVETETVSARTNLRIKFSFPIPTNKKKRQKHVLCQQLVRLSLLLTFVPGHVTQPEVTFDLGSGNPIKTVLVVAMATV